MSSDGISQDHLNGYSGFLLAVFIVVSIFVIWPVKIPLPGFLQSVILKTLKAVRIIGKPEYDSLSSRKLHFHLSLETAPLIGVIILLASTTIDGSTIRLGVKGDENVKPYDVLVLFISLAYIAIALDGTGALEAIAFWVSKKGGDSGLRLFTYLYVFFLGVGCIVGNDPLILSGTPFLAYLTQNTGLEPTAWVFAEFMAANTASAVLVSSNPTNVLIAGSFNLNFLTGFTKWTVLPSLLPGFLTFPVLLAMFWKQIPKKIQPLQDDPWSKLRDPIGAVFFSVLLVVTVFVLVGTSFVPGQKVEVWMVTAPAGILAFLFDLGNDWWHYKFRESAEEQGAEEQGAEDQAADMRPIDRTISKASSMRRRPSFASRMSSRLDTNYAVATATTSSTDDKQAVESDSPSNLKASSSPESSGPKTLAFLARSFKVRFPGTSLTISRLPLTLLPFAICEFILVRGLAQRSWINTFAHGFARACPNPAATVFFFGFISAMALCPLAGTNIGATIILVEILRDPAFSQAEHILKDPRIMQGAIISVALGSNIGAFSYCFCGSLAGLLWRNLLKDKGIEISQKKFAMVNFLPLLLQIVVASSIIYAQLFFMGGYAVVSSS